MPRRAFIVHGWDGHSGEGWFPWLKKELTVNGFVADVLAMPDPRRPVIAGWVGRISQAVGAPDEQTFLVGHSIGVQAILRYLQALGAGQRIGGAVLVAGWMTLTDDAYEQDDDREIAKPWLETPLDWGKIKSRTGNFTAIFSDSDPFVPLADADVFHERLGAEVIIEQGKGHFSGSDGVTELPSARDALLRYVGAI